MENEKKTENETERTRSPAERKAYRRARAATWMKLVFFYHLGVYLAVLVLLYAINAQVSDGYLWVKWPAMFWGIGVTIHGLTVLFLSRVSGIKTRIMKAELAKELNKSNSAE